MLKILADEIGDGHNNASELAFFFLIRPMSLNIIKLP